MEKRYEARAITSNGTDVAQVIIYSHYSSFDEAIDGVKRFCKTYEGTFVHVLKVEIEEKFPLIYKKR